MKQTNKDLKQNSGLEGLDICIYLVINELE